MNAAAAVEQRSWSQPGEETNNMAQMTGDLDDLSNIFNIADFDLESIQNVNASQYGESIHTSHAEAHPTTPYLDSLSQQPSHGTATHDFGDHDNFGLNGDVDAQQYDAHTEQGIDYNGNALYHQQLPQHFSHMHQSPFSMALQQTQHYTSAGQIPPTPNSFEMHGEAGRFLQQQQQQQQQQQVMYEQQKQIRNFEQQQRQLQRAQFTPMASPDGTPQYALQSEFTTPGAYFSPLTSPALHAQMAPVSRPLVQQAQGYFTNPSTAPSSNAPSPVDLHNDVEMTEAVHMNTDSGKRVRRKMVTPRSINPINTRPRQSPIQKPQKRKSALLSSIVPAKDLDKMLADGMPSGQVQPASSITHISQTFDSSESGSISPEPLSESLMGPPPRPSTSGKNSPSLNAQQHSHLVNFGGKAAAATPKSILSLRSQHIDNAKGSPLNTSAASLEDLELPEAASKQRPTLSKIDIAAAESTTSNPRKTPKLGPSSTPSVLRPDSASASPVTSFSPIIGSTPTGLLKDRKDSKTKTSKKRGSTGATSSALASPALRPRISPSIKPLLPEGSALHSPTHALLLASKSNYQNLLEGNHLPGVNYPDSLSTGLTSKRTSHKVAEQGRRNRINEALKEMQSLIPSPGILAKQGPEDANNSKDEDGSPDADDCKDSKESAAAKSNSSKAATVESANRYIRLLKESDASQKAAILALKRENDEIRRRLARATGLEDMHDTEMACIEEVDVQTSDSSSA